MAKGVIFTIDVIFALITATTLIIMSLFLFSHPYTYPEILQYDILAVMEKSSMLHELVEGNKTPAQEYLDSIPYNKCAKLSIQNTTIVKTGCTTSGTKSVAYRIFYNENPYIAKVEVWS